jgi:hypothetical protein
MCIYCKHNHGKPSTIFIRFFGLLRDKVFAYVKDEGSNLSTLTNALTFVWVFVLPFHYHVPLVAHVLDISCQRQTQYNIGDIKVRSGFSEVSLKVVQTSL